MMKKILERLIVDVSKVVSSILCLITVVIVGKKTV